MLIIYKASAGSGKTYQLAKEYIRNLIGVKIEDSEKYILNLPKYNQGISEAKNRHRFILAITFTNKATEEMKRRIIDELDILTRMPHVVDGEVKDSNYAGEFCRDFGCTRDELAEASRRALHQLLNDYSQFNVTTIDSFFQRVLRTFARELDRQGDFSVQIDDKQAVQTSVGMMLDEYNRNDNSNRELGSWIYSYMMRQIESGSKSNFFNRNSHLYTSLISVVTKICEERFKPYAEDMELYLADPTKLQKLRQAIDDKQHQLLLSVKAVTDHSMSALAESGVTLDSLKKTYVKIRNLISGPFHEGRLGDTKYIITEPTFGKIADGLTDPFLKGAKVSDEDMDLFVSMMVQIKALYTEHAILCDLYESVEQLALLRHAWKYLATFKADNNMLLLSDTNHLLERIIGDDDTPFIYERMGTQIRNFLIDEFQDTSKMQWRNLKPLVTNALSTDTDSLIIGDEKQSIYRFRNSDSSLLHSQVTEHDFPPDITDIRGSAPGQNTNYRSAADIVKFNNSLFKIITDRQGIEGFENVIQEIAPKHRDLQGYIRFIPHPEKDAEKDVLDIMAENMMAQHDLGGYSWSDIAILVSKNDEGEAAVDRLINKYPQIPVLSDEALFVSKSHAVQLVVDILKILANEQPNKFGAKQPAEPKGFPTSAEISIAMSRFGFFRNKGLCAEEAIDRALDPSIAADSGLSSCIEAVKQRKPSSLVSLVETIIHEVIPEGERLSQISFLNAFQDYVIDFCSRNTPSLRQLLSDWDKTKYSLSVASAADIDAVKVMTVHKSKGLEFECVHIPFGSWPEIGRERGQWIKFPTQAGIDPEICPPAIYLTYNNKYANAGSYFCDDYAQDEAERLVDVMNMTYVAYTRAGRELTVYYNPTKGIGVRLADTFSTARPLDHPCTCSLGECFDAETMVFTMGRPTHKSERKKNKDEAKATDTIKLDSYNSYYHSGAEVITRVEDMLDIDRDINSADSDDDDYTFVIDEEARQRGILLHDILSDVYRLDDIDRAIRHVALKRRVDKQRCLEARQILTELLDTNDERINRWFVDNDKVLNEQSILLPDGYVPPRPRKEGEEVDFRRPDRLVFYGDSVDVIDYKFTTEVRSAHKTQIREYIDILQKMGFSNVKGYLWYPLRHQIVETN